MNLVGREKKLCILNWSVHLTQYSFERWGLEIECNVSPENISFNNIHYRYCTLSPRALNCHSCIERGITYLFTRMSGLLAMK